MIVLRVGVPVQAVARMVLNILNRHGEIWITASGSDEKSVSLTDLILARLS